MKDQSQRACCKVSSRRPVRARQGAPLVRAESSDPLYVLFTVDVEVRADGNVERDIWGELPGEEQRHGIDQMMDVFDQYGVKGTFFVDAFGAAKHGCEPMVHVCRRIVERGHDLQLHTHPRPVYGVEGIQEADLAKQVIILRQGAQWIKEWTDVNVTAHRAGGYMADLNTVSACAQVRILMEFSCNAAWPDSGLGRTGLTCNAAFVREGVLCVPVTCHVQAGLGRWQSVRSLDIESSSVAEILRILKDLQRRGVRTAVIMMHSFCFCRGGRVNRRVEQALRRVLDALAADVTMKVVSARQLAEVWRARPEAVIGPDHLPKTGWWTTYCRAWQRLGEGWKNVAVAFVPLATAFLLAAAALAAVIVRMNRE